MEIKEENHSASFALSRSALTALVKDIQRASSIAILPHTNPDGDAVGSTIAWSEVLKSAYPDKEISVVSPDFIERYLTWMPHVGSILCFPADQAGALRLLEKADLIFHVDHNQTSRLRYLPLVEAVRANKGKKYLVDHHLEPEEGLDASFSFPGVSSTCELMYGIIKALGWTHYISADVATLLLTGIVTDTGRLMYGCFSPSLYQHFSELLALGADYAYIIDALSYHNPLSLLRLQGYALHERLEIYPDLSTAVIMLSAEEMHRLEVSKGDTEGLVNLPLSVEGIRSSCFIREDRDQIKLSFRSIGDLPINLVASRGFGGGGHLNAAGGEYHGTLEEAKKMYLYELEKLLNEGW